MSQEVSEQVIKAGSEFFDAPVSGGVGGAEARARRSNCLDRVGDKLLLEPFLTFTTLLLRNSTATQAGTLTFMVGAANEAAFERAAAASGHAVLTPSSRSSPLP